MKTKPSNNSVTIVARDSRPGIRSKSFTVYDTNPETVIKTLKRFCESQPSTAVPGVHGGAEGAAKDQSSSSAG